MVKHMGHYPYIMCSLTNVVLNASDGVFYYASKDPLLSDCGDLDTVWQLQNRPQQSQTEIQCDEEYDIGHIFLIFFFAGGSNYYHLHYDTMLPLYKDVVVGQNDSQGPSRVFMPAVETSRLQKINWKTPAFEKADKYWVQTTKVGCVAVNTVTLVILVNLHRAYQQYIYIQLYIYIYIYIFIYIYIYIYIHIYTY